MAKCPRCGMERKRGRHICINPTVPPRLSKSQRKLKKARERRREEAAEREQRVAALIQSQKVDPNELRSWKFTKTQLPPKQPPYAKVVAILKAGTPAERQARKRA